MPPVPPTTKLVLVNCYDAAGTPSIVPDDRECQRRLVRACMDRGHRRIAYLTLREQLVATGLRTEGYRDALCEAGLEFDPALVVSGDHPIDAEDPGTMSDALDGVLSLESAPTLICCGNDRMAMRAYGLLRSRGLDIPRDISVAGFDNYRLIAETLFPRLTTVDLPYTEMGRRAADTLMLLISDERAGQGGPETVAGDVAWRDSVVALDTR